MVEYCRKYTVGHGVGRGSHPGCRPWSCGDRAGVLPTPAVGVVVAVGCTVLQMWRGHVPWALQVRVLHAPAVTGHVAIPDPHEWSAGARTRRSGRHTEFPDPSRGRSETPAASAERPSLRGTWRRRTPSRAGGGSGVIRVMRWSSDSRSWQNSNGNCAERVSSRIAGSTVLPQRPGWRSSDRSWRTGFRSQPLWGMAA